MFLAGASGVVGVRLIPLLVAAGHAVAGMTRTPAKVALLRRLGATPVLCDVFAPENLRQALAALHPDLVVHLLTDLPDDPARLPEFAAVCARIRREGTANLLAAAKGSGAPRCVAQSVAWPLNGDGGAAVSDLERQVLAADGVVVRYGRFYGPGTYHASAPPPPPRIHVDAAALRTLPLLDKPCGIVVLAED